MATKKRKVKSDAEKSADFKKIAGKHAATAIAAIARLAKCARPGKYKWTDADVKFLREKFAAAFKSCFDRFDAPPATDGVKMTKNLFDAKE